MMLGLPVLAAINLRGGDQRHRQVKPRQREPPKGSGPAAPMVCVNARQASGTSLPSRPRDQQPVGVQAPVVGLSRWHLPSAAGEGHERMIIGLDQFRAPQRNMLPIHPLVARVHEFGIHFEVTDAHSLDETVIKVPVRFTNLWMGKQERRELWRFVSSFRINRRGARTRFVERKAARLSKRAMQAFFGR